MEQTSLYEKISKFGLICVINGLDRHGSVWSARHICEAIEETDESLLDFLLLLNKYGAYDILVAISVIVNLLCSNNIKQWFHEKLSQCSDSEMVLRISNTFYQSQVTMLSNIFAKVHVETDYVLSVNVPQFESFIWENYDSNFLKKIGRRDARNIGVWFPMIYDKLAINEHIKKLEENGFPYLLMCAKDIREGVINNKSLEAVVRMRIADYLSELALSYYSNIEHILDRLLEMDPRVLAQSDHNEYFLNLEKFLKEELGYQLHITDDMTNYLSEMIRISEYFGDSLLRKNVLEMKVFLPLFYQMLGRNEEALTLLLDTVRYFHHIDIARKEYLLVFYRSLLITNDERKRQLIIGIFDELYLNSSAEREFFAVANHINIFYEKYCTDILERKKYLLEYSGFFCQDKEYELLTRWFANELVLNRFKSLLHIMMNDSGFRKNRAINDYMILFYSLTAHRDCNIRISPYAGAKILGDNYFWNSFDEIYDFYTNEEQQQICIFREQMDLVKSKMLSFDWQEKYNLVKQKAELFWNMDEESILCSKLLTAFRGIQSDPYNKWEYYKHGNKLRKRAEDSINNLVAFFLKAYYGEENVHREEKNRRDFLLIKTSLVKLTS